MRLGDRRKIYAPHLLFIMFAGISGVAVEKVARQSGKL
jgi:hypothetical protein